MPVRKGIGMGERTGEKADQPRKHILVAEDEPVVRELLRAVLEHKGYAVHEAGNGRQAADYARASQVDLVLTDLWMPEMNGVELIEELNRTGSRAEVLVLSAHVTETSTEKLEGLGVFRILAKPVDLNVLLEAVEGGLASDRVERISAKRAPAPEREEAGAPPSRATVLVADDDGQVRDLLRALLSGAGYAVEEAMNGQEAVEKALAYDIDLIITDLNMPQMSGREAIETLRRATRDTFIICITGEATRKEMDAAVHAGAVKCLRKPFAPQQLLSEVERLDLLAVHRRRLAQRERELLAAAPLQRRGRHKKWLLVATLVVVAAGAIAVPVIIVMMRAAGKAADKVKDATDAIDRVEGYLQRDEQREIERDRR